MQSICANRVQMEKIPIKKTNLLWVFNVDISKAEIRV
jgi:hypothetical protein